MFSRAGLKATAIGTKVAETAFEAMESTGDVGSLGEEEDFLPFLPPPVFAFDNLGSGKSPN